MWHNTGMGGLPAARLIVFAFLLVAPTACAPNYRALTNEAGALGAACTQAATQFSVTLTTEARREVLSRGRRSIALNLKDPDDLEIAVKFSEAKPAVTEAERLENIKRRKDLGINEQVDLIMLDNPDMTREEAEDKLKKILAEKLQRSSAFAPPPAKPEGEAMEEEHEEMDDEDMEKVSA